MEEWILSYFAMKRRWVYLVGVIGYVVVLCVTNMGKGDPQIADQDW